MSITEIIRGMKWRNDASQKQPLWDRLIAAIDRLWRSISDQWFPGRNAELIDDDSQLQAMLEEKNRRLATMVHDLKTPLLGIQRLSEMLVDREQLSPDGRRKLNLIETSAMEAMNYVDTLLSSVAERSRSNRQAECVDLALVAERVLRAFEPHAERKEQVIDYAARGGHFFVRGSEFEIREAMNNLVSNALKFSPPNETIEVILEGQQDTITFSVVDYGPGLSPSDEERLFEPHECLTSDATGGERSSGLGLFFAKQIVEFHGGDILVDSEEGKGSTFSLSLPRARPDATSSAPEESPASSREIEGPGSERSEVHV